MADPVTQAPTGSEPAAPASVGASLYPTGGDNPTPNAAVVDAKTGAEVVPPVPANGVVVSPVVPPVVDPAPVEVKPEVKVDEVKPDPASPEAKAAAEAASAALLASYDIKLPETVQVDPASMAQFKEVAASLGLDNASAQKVMDILPAVLAKQVEAITAANQQAYNETQTKWVAEANALPEFQGEARSNTLAILGRAMDEFGSPEAREFLNVTGAGNNPHVIKYILSMANALMEGSPSTQGGPTSQAKSNRSLGQRLYPDLQQ